MSTRTGITEGQHSVQWRVPGRLEVLGKHTDYGGGAVLVGAVDRAVTVTGELLSESAPQPETVVVASTDLAPDPVTLTIGEPDSQPPGHWSHYVRAAAERLHANFGPLGRVSLHMTSDLPPASGMSSSSAVLTGAALVLADLAGLTARPAWTQTMTERLDLAGYAASIESGRPFKNLPGQPGVGTSGGSLDHTGMLTSEAGKLSLASFDPPAIHARIPMPPDHVFVVAVSGVLAEKTGAARDAYNRGPRVLSDILARYQASRETNAATIHSAVRELLSREPQDEMTPIDPQDPRLAPLRDCARMEERTRLDQFLEESGRIVPAAAEALAAQDLERFGDLVAQSQELAENGLHNQIPETVALVELARELGAVATSAFGAGFGGSVWALIPTGDAEEFAQAWLSRYRSRFEHPHASVLVTGAGAAAQRLHP